MNKKHMAALLGTFVCWGSVYVAAKLAMSSIPPVTMLALRYVVAIPALFLLLKVRGTLRSVDRRHMPVLFVIGFMGYFASFCMQMMGINRLTGSVASLLGAMNPIFIPVLAAVFLREKLTKEKIGCVALSMAGVALIVGVKGTADVAGVILILLSVFLWSATSIVIRRLGGAYDPMQVTMTAMAVALLFTGMLAMAELRTSPCVFTPRAVAAVVYMGIVGTAVAHSLWNYCLSKMDASFCSMFYPLQPLVASALGVVLLGEQITANFLLGGAIVCAGIVAAVRSGRKAS